MLSGNEAIARGAYEAGVRVCSAYPGTPSTEIFENLPQYKDELYCEWAPNEKVATEVAYGASIAGVSSITAMKHVGLNVAADPVFTAAYNGVGGGFVIVTADDPSMHSSQNEQDNRYYAKRGQDRPGGALRLPGVQGLHAPRPTASPSASTCRCSSAPRPASPTPRAWWNSANARSTRPKPYQEEHPQEHVRPRANAYRNHPKVEANLKALAEYGNTCPLQKLEMGDGEIGVITASIAYQYAKDAFPEGTSFLKLGLTYPLPMELIRDFAARVETLYVIEELEGFMEEQIKAAGIPCIGKEKVSNMYELNPQRLRQMLFGTEPEIKELPVKPVSRPPALCPGCPHRGFFYTMSKHKDFVVAGDIGCYTLGARPRSTPWTPACAWAAASRSAPA